MKTFWLDPTACMSCAKSPAASLSANPPAPPRSHLRARLRCRCRAKVEEGHQKTPFGCAATPFLIHEPEVHKMDRGMQREAAGSS
mgnify:CR=1 FL=1